MQDSGSQCQNILVSVVIKSLGLVHASVDEDGLCGLLSSVMVTLEDPELCCPNA